MYAHAIDTLAASNSLKEAGLDEKQAAAIVKVYDEASQLAKDTFATKEDLANTEQALQSEIQLVRSDVEKMEQGLQSEIQLVRSDMEKMEQGLQSEIQLVRSDMEKMEQGLQSEIQLVRSDVEKMEKTVESKFYKLVVANLAGVAVIFSLIEGFKSVAAG